MGTDRSRDQYEGILIMDPRITAINVAGTTATEDSPQTGPITADAGFSTEAVIVASGTPEDGDSLLLRGMKAGSPGISRAGFAWRETIADTWNGWEVPNKIGSFEFVENATSANDGFPHPQPIPLDDGTIVILAGDDTFNFRGVSRRIRNVDGTYGASSQLHSEVANVTSDRLHPRGILLPSGRLMVYYAVMDLERNTFQIRMQYTDNPAAASYELGARNVLSEEFGLPGVGTGLSGMRIAYSPDTGQFLILVSIDTSAQSRIYQYASRNGVLFEPVGHPGGEPVFDFDADFLCGQGTGQFDLLYSNGYFVMVYKQPDFLPLFGDSPRWRRVGSAFSAMAAASDIGVGAGNMLAGGTTAALSIVAADDGTLYTYGRAEGTLGFSASEDGGASWTEGATGGIVWGQGGVESTAHSACWYRGYVYMVTNQTAPAVNVLALTALRLGGYADLNMPPEGLTTTSPRQSWWGRGWVGHDMPSIFFSDVSVGAPVETRNLDGSWKVATGALVTAIHENGLTDIADYRDVMGEARLRRNSGTGKFAVQSSESTSPNHTEAEIRVDADVRLFDVNGAQIGATVVGAGATVVDLRLAVNGLSCTGWYSVVDNGSHVKKWIKIGTTAALVEVATSVEDRIQLITVPSSDVDWFYAFVQRDQENVALGADTIIAESMADDVTLPDDLFARSLPAIGASYVNDGVSIRGIDGPILRGVEMTMEITHPSPIESILPFVQPSPRKYWLSASASADQEIVFSIATQGEEAHSGSDLIAIYLGNCNVQNVRVETLNTGGTWDLLTNISRAETGLAFIRTGSTIIPDETSTIQGEYYHRNELAGSYFVVNVGSGKTRTITGNTEGHFTSGASVAEKRCVIYLDPDEMDGTEATSGTTGAIVHRDTITYRHLVGAHNWRAYRLTVNDSAVAAVDAPPGAKHRCGAAVIGPVAVFGKRQDNAYSVTREAQVESQTLIDGTRRSRVLGPSKRTMTINFSDGVDVTTARGSGDADYVKGYDAPVADPIAHNRDLPLMIDGLIDQLDGPDSLVVYCPNIPQGSASKGAVFTFRAGRAGGTIYGRITSAVGLNAVVGDPMLTEVLTGPSITIEEEV